MYVPADRQTEKAQSRINVAAYNAIDNNLDVVLEHLRELGLTFSARNRLERKVFELFADMETECWEQDIKDGAND